MFGRGKESLTLAAGDRIRLDLERSRQSEDDGEIQIPTQLNPIFDDSLLALQEYERLKEEARKIKIPVGKSHAAFQERFDVLETQILGANNTLEALSLGYEFHQVPDDFYFGYFSQDDVLKYRTHRKAGSIYKQPIPLIVEERYKNARKTKLFKELVIASPNILLFIDLQSEGSYSELIGIVQTNSEYYHDVNHSYKPGLHITGGVQFSIASWTPGGVSPSKLASV